MGAFSSLSWELQPGERKAKGLRKMFSHDRSPKIVEQLIENPESATLGEHRREVVVLIFDVPGFTTFSVKRKPEEVVVHLNEYLQERTDGMFKWAGRSTNSWATQSWHSGARRLTRCDVPVNNGGSADKRMDNTIIGDHVNLGARVETLTRKYDTRMPIIQFPSRRSGLSSRRASSAGRDEGDGQGEGERQGHPCRDTRHSLRAQSDLAIALTGRLASFLRMVISPK